MTSLLNPVSAENTCQYAVSATATSSNDISEPLYATGVPDGNGNCSLWSGTGSSWSPANWSIKANLTLNYDIPVYARNFTIFGDQNICWNRMWLKNSITEKEILIFEGNDYNCTSTFILDRSFLADIIILETCGWGWSATDAVRLCGDMIASSVDVYLIPYIGDIDGNIDSDWYFFYDQLRLWHDNNAISAGFSFYPNTMNNQINPKFSRIIKDMYFSENIELITKGESKVNGTLIDWLSYDEVHSHIELLQNQFTAEMDVLGHPGAKAPVAYNQNQGRFTETIRNATYDLGFKIYFDQFVSEYGYIDQLHDYDVMQYTVSFTTTGLAGPDQTFKLSDDIISEILNFSHSYMLYIDGIKVVSLMAHQQDFRTDETSSILDTQKWDTYTEVLLTAKNNSRIQLINPEDIYDLRHTGLVEICSWQDCRSGAASLSVDDSHPSCRSKLNAHGWKGTYYLFNTTYFSQSDWDLWQDMYDEGHEIGCHTQTHPCTEVNDTVLIYELSSNRKDILANLDMPSEEVTSFAWPCGFNTPHEKDIAHEYFISARGYHINELEDRNPSDFMNLKSISTPHYHDPPLDPPNLTLTIDQAEQQKKWINMVFHHECLDDGAIDYLATKDIWVETVGRISKYIIERQDAEIHNVRTTPSLISFDLVSSLDNALYSQKLTLKVSTDNSSVKDLRINNISHTFTPFTENNNKDNNTFIRFNILPGENNHIEITLEAKPVCGNRILEPGEDCDGSDFGSKTCASYSFSAGTLSCSSNCTIIVGGCYHQDTSSSSSGSKKSNSPGTGNIILQTAEEINETENKTTGIIEGLPKKNAGKLCVEKWVCSEWKQCEYNFQSRKCVDINSCGTEKNIPSEIQVCPDSDKKIYMSVPEKNIFFPTGLVSFSALAEHHNLAMIAIILIAAILIYLYFKRRTE